jgi:hypothetical protein
MFHLTAIYAKWESARFNGRMMSIIAVANRLTFGVSPVQTGSSGSMEAIFFHRVVAIHPSLTVG